MSSRIHRSPLRGRSHFERDDSSSTPKVKDGAQSSSGSSASSSSSSSWWHSDVSRAADARAAYQARRISENLGGGARPDLGNQFDGHVHGELDLAGREFTHSTDNTLYEGRFGSVSTSVGVRGGQEAYAVGGTLSGSFSRDAFASAQAQYNQEAKGRLGHAGLDVIALSEGAARVYAHGDVTRKAVDLSARAELAARAETEVHTFLESNEVNIGGEAHQAVVELNGRLVAEAGTFVETELKLGRDPAEAVLEGKLGASAVLKAETDTELILGPLALEAYAYTSVGAEASVGFTLGYDDGVLKLGGNAGAAMGLGAGGGATFLVDVGSVGRTVHGVLDVNDDQKLGFSDVTAAGRNVVRSAVEDVRRVSSAVGELGRALDRTGDGRVGFDDAVRASHEAYQAAAQTVSSAARGVARFFGF